MSRTVSLLIISVLIVVCGPLRMTSGETVVVTIQASDPTAVIDQHVQQKWTELQVVPADCCSDRDFLRRVFLDLAGRVPTPAEVESFLTDDNADRRVRLIDHLLASEDYVQHFADLFDTLLMGRAAENKYAERKSHHWRSYLENIIRDNRPWNEVASEILLARPEQAGEQGAVWFLYERNNQHQQIAEAIAPAFFGVRIECAQCHDHMLADEIKQDHYWGLVAFFNRSKNENTNSGPRLAESAIGGFSEFANIEGDSSPNLLSFLGAETVFEDRPGKDAKQEDSDDLYRAAIHEHEPRVPKFSRREKFVQHVVQNHPMIARAMVNRLWAIMMARGMVHPFDEMDSVHEPSHPELLDALTEDFISSQYDIRRLVGALARSQAYQLSSIQPPGVEDPSSFAWYLERPLTGEQLARSIQLIVRAQFSNDDESVGLFRQQFKDVLPDQNVVTVSDTLFLSNSPGFDQFLRESTQPDHFVPRLMQLEDHDARIAALCQTVFGRPPSDDERKMIYAYLEPRGTALDSALIQVVWAMLTSAEFRFNH